MMVTITWPVIKLKTPRFKVIDRKIIFSKDIVDLSEGLSELLFVKEFDKNKVRKKMLNSTIVFMDS